MPVEILLQSVRDRGRSASRHMRRGHWRDGIVCETSMRRRIPTRASIVKPITYNTTGEQPVQPTLWRSEYVP
jgi:hypothetical protein